MSKRILVTGGAGFIGSRLVKELARQDLSSEIWIFDSLHPQVHGAGASALELAKNVTFIKGDVEDIESVHQAMCEARPELVYHLAAETGTGQSYDEPTRYCGVNVTGTANLIEAMRRTDAVARVVLAASRAVYGEGGYMDVDGREFVGSPRTSEAMRAGDFSVALPPAAHEPSKAIASHSGLPPSPSSIYASTKLMQEYLLQQAGGAPGWEATILRFQNVYGPGQSLRNPYTGVLSIFASQLLAGKRLAIFEDGEIARDFVFVDDVVKALVLAGRVSVAHGTILDIGSGKAVTILSVARILMRALGVPTDAYEITGAFRAGDIRHACADIRAAKDVLGWSPDISIDDGLNQLAQWAKTEYPQVSVEVQ